MANKDRNKRSARKARAEERARLEALQAQGESAATPASSKPAKAKEAKASKPKKRGFFGRIAAWFGEVRTELRRVIWPSRDELKNYSVGVILTLVVLGIVIWLIDMGLVSLLSVFAGLRG